MTDATLHSPNGTLPPAIALLPTWRGYVADTREALILFEAVLQRFLDPVVRRPHDRERAILIRSGSIFIYEEGASGIKRWTDGVPWSPSRILNNFLIYRELVKPFPPGEKKRANKKAKKESRPGEPYPRTNSSEDFPTSAATRQLSPTSSKSEQGQIGTDKDAERSLIGSLTDSYSFKEDGLVKKTMSVTVEGRHLHLVSYYNPQDVRSGHLLLRPSEDAGLGQLRPRPDLLHRQNFRAPLDDVDEVTSSAYSTSPQHQQQYVPNPHVGFGGMEGDYHSHPMQQYYASAPTSPYGMSVQHAQHMQHSTMQHSTMQNSTMEHSVMHPLPYSPPSRYPDGVGRQMALSCPPQGPQTNYYHAHTPGGQMGMRGNYAPMAMYPDHSQQRGPMPNQQDHYSMHSAPVQSWPL